MRVYAVHGARASGGAEEGRDRREKGRGGEREGEREGEAILCRYITADVA